MQTVRACRNMFGNRIDDECAQSIETFIQDPTFDHWDIASSVIVASPFTTLWNAVIAIDPSFPHKGRVTDIDGNVLREWEALPTPLLVLQAIKQAQTTQ